MAAVRQAIQSRASQSFAAEHLSPVFEWQICRDDQARMECSITNSATAVNGQYLGLGGKGSSSELTAHPATRQKDFPGSRPELQWKPVPGSDN